ncbi:hypothetical protein [Galbibacter pacificus]|uniref:Uncharacterized protein n=1 Tax=Galbibacter pacificus TaxID=2996052 RepID=A0ABT6FS19_9FLAO|nr:hypothetical protein [Galbibacter pacificus]MDG3582826.1 hypothetical protein [Galbibacter pacificus]MDG3586055.1 hypothetical protein [Galbibacter pacificus]
MKKNVILGIAISILCIPLFMWVAWLCSPKQKLVIAIIDKTVVNKGTQEHLSLSWVLNHNKFSKTSKELYKSDRDYFGFFPLNENKYKVKGLERFSFEQLEQLSLDCDAVYYTDAYGLYNMDWYKEKKPYGILYGGLSDQDIEFLQLMKQKKKPIITEFNILGDPTDMENREKFESLFHIQWTGWSGRYYKSLNKKVNKELPTWVVNNYEKSNNATWSFQKEGIVLVKGAQVVVLEMEKELKTAHPFIVSNSKAQSMYAVPEKINYTFWFDIIKIDSNYNESNAVYHLDVTKKGNMILKKNNIPNSFPAVTTNKSGSYKFTYLSGDFCDNKISLNTSYFKGIEIFQSTFYDSENLESQKEFFWRFYKPMISNILKDYIHE